MTTLTPTRRRRYQRHPARWAVEVAARLGCRPQTAEALVHGRLPLQARFAALVAAAIRLGDRRLLDKLMAPVDAALARLKEEPLAPDLMLAAQEADMAEELAEARFHADPSHAHRHQWAAAVRHQRAQSLRLLLALEAE